MAAASDLADELEALSKQDRFSIVDLGVCAQDNLPTILSALLDTEVMTAALKSDQPRPSVATGHPEQGALLSGWRPIESAPTDGRSVLVFCPRASDHGYERIRLTWRKDGKWQGANNTSWPPTHWMPLPSSPKP